MKLSVIVPCHDAETHLTSCLESVLTPARDDLEVIAVDDGSTDGTRALLEAWAVREPRLTVLRVSASRGPGHARNLGIERASGEYVWFVDADDTLPPNAVEMMVDALTEVDADVLIVDHAEVFGAAVVRRRARDLVGRLHGTTTLVEFPRLLRLAPSPCTKIVRRKLLTTSGLRFPAGRYEDAFYSPAVLLSAERIAILDEVLYLYRQDRPGSITSTPSPAHFDVFDQYERLFAHLNNADDRHESLRPELFRVMIDHYLVVLGHRSRIPPTMRRTFFRRVVRDYRRFIPQGGYPRPSGAGGVKHRLVRLGAYRAYAALRWSYRTLPRRSPSKRGR
jgi:glycosyltransferase involved in cell wall biosynthesis